MSKIKQSGLAAVQDLYIAHFELQKLLESGLRTPNQVEEAKRCLKQFKILLKSADPQYMGGEDVLDALRAMHEKMSERVKKSPSRSR